VNQSLAGAHRHLKELHEKKPGQVPYVPSIRALGKAMARTGDEARTTVDITFKVSKKVCV